MTHTTTDRVLYALFCLSRDTQHIDAAELARATGVTATAAAEALVALERAGLVDASRARLTMLGLARAARLGGQGGGRPSIDLEHARPRSAAAPRAPLAAAPDHSARERAADDSARVATPTVTYSYRELADGNDSRHQGLGKIIGRCAGIE